MSELHRELRGAAGGRPRHTGAGRGPERRARRRAAPVLALLLLLAAAAAPADGPLSVYVTIPPQAYFVERIAGELVNVGVLVGPGQSPHAYDPSPRQMAELVDSDVFFTVGLPFEEELLPRIRRLAPDLEVVATDYPVPKREMESAAGGRHGDHGRRDPHIWMDPDRVKIQARVIARTLERHDPSHDATYAANLESFIAELDSLDARITRALAPVEGSRLYVFHAAFGYFADAYGLEQVPVEVGGKEPSARQLARLIERATADGARVIFVQPQFSTTAAEAVADAIDGVVVPIDPLARDYAANLERVADAVRTGLQGE
jgi:zinc transport system substrate-binding protein